MPIIQLDRISKQFKLQPDKPRSFQDLALGLFDRSRRTPAETLWAVRDLTFAVEPGETLGIIGSNGSGKSTCLKLLTRILEPTTGTLSVRGRVSALLELGAGFHPELTGRDNVYLQGSVLGINRREMARRFDDIVAFAELDRFIDVPVKVYSSGMYVRLAFATAINVSADILLVDEVLAVGDQSFQDKCLERIQQLKAQGVTIVFVSHDLDSVRNVCTRAVWLDRGTLCDDGLTEAVVMRYVQHEHDRDDAARRQRQQTARHTPPSEAIHEPAAQSEAAPLEKAPLPEVAPQAEAEPANGLRFQPGRWGSGEVVIEEVLFEDDAGHEILSLTTGQPATVAIRYHARQRVADPVFGVAIFRNDGLHMSGANTHLAHLELGAIEGRGVVRYRMEAVPFLAGGYLLTVAIHDRAETHTYDYHSLGYPFRVRLGDVRERYGTLYVPATWSHAESPAGTETPEEVAR